jgi:hypothetical protein
MTRRGGKVARIALVSLCGRVFFLGHDCPGDSRCGSILPAANLVGESVCYRGRVVAGSADCRGQRSQALATRISPFDTRWAVVGRGERTHLLGLRFGSKWAGSAAISHYGAVDDAHR